MRRTRVGRSGLALGLSLALLALPARPAVAGGVQYTDVAGDARDVYNVKLDARPSDPELDLRAVAWATSADELTVTTTLTAVGDPVASNGWAVSHYFDYAGFDFELLVQNSGTPSDQVFTDGVYLRNEGDSTIEYPCVCRMVVDPAKRQVTVRIELHSIGSAARAIDPRAKRPGPGSVFEISGTTTFRMAGFLLAADKAFPSRARSLTL